MTKICFEIKQLGYFQKACSCNSVASISAKVESLIFEGLFAWKSKNQQKSKFCVFLLFNFSLKKIPSQSLHYT